MSPNIHENCESRFCKGGRNDFKVSDHSSLSKRRRGFGIQQVRDENLVGHIREQHPCIRRYGLEDSQSCLLVADMGRLERAPFISGMGPLLSSLAYRSKLVMNPGLGMKAYKALHCMSAGLKSCCIRHINRRQQQK